MSIENKLKGEKKKRCKQLRPTPLVLTLKRNMDYFGPSTRWFRRTICTARKHEADERGRKLRRH